MKFRSRPPVSLNCFQGQEFREAAFYSSKNYGLCIFLACAEIIFTSEKGVIFLEFLYSEYPPLFVDSIYEMFSQTSFRARSFNSHNSKVKVC